MNARVARFAKTCTRTYLQNHFAEIFGPSYAITYIAQTGKHGYVRTDIEREKIAKYAENRLDNALKLGLLPTYEKSK